MSDASHTDLPAGAELVGGQPHVRDSKGRLVPLELVKEQDRLQDDVVRELLTRATEQSAALGAFKAQAFADVEALLQLLDERYDAKPMGPRGNVTLTTFDGLMQVQVQRADLIEFGAELQTAKNLIDECLAEWSADSSAELRAIVMNAFDPGKKGQINRGALLGLLRLEIAEPRWQRAMQAIKESIRITGSKEYIRFRRRASPTGEWRAVSLDLATVPLPANDA